MNKDAIIRKAKGAFGKVQSLMPNARMFLLKREPHSKEFTSVAEITVPFWSRWSGFREATVFQWADEAAEWMDRVAQSSHVGFGVPAGEDDEIDVYSVAFDQRDRIAPIGSNLLWKLYGTREVDEVYAIPEVTP